MYFFYCTIYLFVTDKSIPSTSMLASESDKTSEVQVPFHPQKKAVQIQDKLTKFVQRPIGISPRKKYMTVLNIIVKDLQPFSIVRDTGFV